MSKNKQDQGIQHLESLFFQFVSIYLP